MSDDDYDTAVISHLVLLPILYSYTYLLSLTQKQLIKTITKTLSL